MDQTQFLQIEECAFAAWPAAEVEACDGWRFRFTHGVTGRANSVWPNGANGRLTPAAKIEAAERFYAKHQLPPQFQVNPHSQPNQLGALLAKRGYAATKPTEVQTAVIATALEKTQPANSRSTLKVEETLSAEWLAFHQAVNQFDPRTLQIREAIMRRIAVPVMFVSAWQEKQIVGAGMGVAANGWLCISNMHVAQDARRLGVATAVLHALLSWGQAQQVDDAFLQVMTNNAPALSLYKKAGFVQRYTYRYFSKR